MSSAQRWLLALLALAGLALLLWYTIPQSQAYLAPFLAVETWQGWRQWIRSFGLLAPLVSMGISVAQLFPLPIPPPTIPLVNGWLFGIWGGALVTWSGVMINGVLGYQLAHGPGRALFGRLVSREQLARAEGILQRHGAAAVVVARIVPLLPFSAVSVAAGLLSMRWRDYLLANALGLLPNSFALALIGHQLSRGEVQWGWVFTGAGLLALAALAGIPLARRLEPNKKAPPIGGASE